MANIRHAVYPWPTTLAAGRLFGSDTVQRASRIPLGRYQLFYGFMGWFVSDSDTYITGGVPVTQQTSAGKGLYNAFDLNWVAAMGLWGPSNICTGTVGVYVPSPCAIMWNNNGQLLELHRAGEADNPELANAAVISALNASFPSILYIVGIGK